MRKILKVRSFPWVVALSVVLVLFILSKLTTVFENIETAFIDLQFRYKTIKERISLQEGVSVQAINPLISSDIVIVGIDLRTLDKFGKWPFPRWRHADLIDSFSRISDQSLRESSVLMDTFFVEPDSNAYNDAILIESIRNSGRVFLETILEKPPPPGESGSEYFLRQQKLYETHGTITSVFGDIDKIPNYYGLQPPLIPYGVAGLGYGHAHFLEDRDQVFRRLPLLLRSSIVLERLGLEELTVEAGDTLGEFERLVWVGSDGTNHTIPMPLTEDSIGALRNQIMKDGVGQSSLSDEAGNASNQDYTIYKYKDSFVPAITLSLALNYLNASLADVEVVLGEYIRIPNPRIYEPDSDSLVPYRLLEKPASYNKAGEITSPAMYRVVQNLDIPIDEQGRMFVNFMGPGSFASRGQRQTYPIRSYYGYASQVPPVQSSEWPRTKGLTNKIVLVGAFSQGLADDQKTTPYGLMYGIELHANALNTMLMSHFIDRASPWIDLLILGSFVLLISLLTVRIHPLLTILIILTFLVGYFLVASVFFETRGLILNYPVPAIGVVIAFLLIVAYRAMMEEKDKRAIKGMFGTYLSPQVVDQILASPPELGGLDKDLTVFFSDIRGFTSISEKMSPQELVQLLNRYLSLMTDIIIANEGTLDKYEGDAIMAFWGAPLQVEEHAFLACKSAIEQLEALRKLNTELPPDQNLRVGMGINSGIMTVGNMGSVQRMDYTLIGDNVNLGARLEGVNKSYGTSIIISENTMQYVKDRVVVRELDNIRVKGKSRPVAVFELLDVVRRSPAIG